MTAPMPPAYRVIPGCVAAAGLLVYLMVAKYCGHLPLYHIQSIFKRRHGVELDRATMRHWLKRCAHILGILYEALRLELLSENYLQIDEPFIKLLDPETKGKARRSNFWVIANPGNGVLFHFDPSRGHEVAAKLLGEQRLDRDRARGADILPSSPLGKAIGYALGLWPGLVRYAEAAHGEVEIDNNRIENAIRPTAIGKKNWLFIGHPKAGQMSAIIYTIIENCCLWEIDPVEYLLDVLPRIMDHPAGRIAELLPRQWKEARREPAEDAA